VDPLRRVEQLIALATDAGASTEEARSAALAACKDIRAKGLSVTEGARKEAPRSSVAVSRRRVGRVPELSGRQASTVVPELPGQDAPKAYLVNWTFEDKPEGSRRDEPVFSLALLGVKR
jgi:hypothetical protein